MSAATTATRPTDATLTAQRAAIEESGWGERFRFFQPHNLMFWVYLWLLVLGAGALLSDAGNLFGAYEQAMVTGYVWFAIYTVPFWLIINYLDRYDAVPGKVRVMSFLWGGLVATFAMSLAANASTLTLYSKLFGQAWAADWGPAFTAPFTEEISKGAGVIVILVLAPKVVRSAFDGLIIGAFIGLGFQVFENVSYVIEGAKGAFGANQGSAALQMIVMRSAVGLTSHALYSALFGMGLVWIIGRPTEPRRIGRGLLFIFGAMFIHGTWDAISALSDGSAGLTALVMIGIPVLAIILFAVALKWSSERPRHWMHDLLAPEAPRGTITDDELTALSGHHKDRRHYIKAAKGHKSHVHAKHVLAAADDLAKQIAIAHGAETPEVDFARAEVFRVRS